MPSPGQGDDEASRVSEPPPASPRPGSGPDPDPDEPDRTILHPLHPGPGPGVGPGHALSPPPYTNPVSPPSALGSGPLSGSRPQGPVLPPGPPVPTVPPHFGGLTGPGGPPGPPGPSTPSWPPAPPGHPDLSPRLDSPRPPAPHLVRPGGPAWSGRTGTTDSAWPAGSVGDAGTSRAPGTPWAAHRHGRPARSALLRLANQIQQR